MRPPSRTSTTFAVGFLLLDALLLVYGGLELRRIGLLIGGALCAAGALVVVVLWKRHRRAVAEIEAARRAMRDDVNAIRDLLQQHHFQN